MRSALIVYSTVDGHTLKICERIRQLLEGGGFAVTLVDVDVALGMDCGVYDRIVVGASIRYGKHRPSVYTFIARNRARLSQPSSAFFSVSAVARKPGKDTPERNPYFKLFVRRSGWSPPIAATFAGKIDYSRYTRVDRMVIRFIMWITHGPTDPDVAVEFTDWAAVEVFAARIAQSEAPPDRRQCSP